MILAAHQPQFAPWLGFFDKADRSDVFVMLDNVQFKKNEWQNRNRIKSSSGPQWLTVPVSFHFGEKISEVAIDFGQDWAGRHLKTLRACYGRAPFFKEGFALYEQVVTRPWENLVDLNLHLLEALLAEVGIGNRLQLASSLSHLPEDPDGRLIECCLKLGAKIYLAGAGGRAYMNLDRYRAAGIAVIFQEYSHPEYPQLFGDFYPRLSVLDLVFNCGPGSLGVIRHGRMEQEKGAV